VKARRQGKPLEKRVRGERPEPLGGEKTV